MMHLTFNMCYALVNCLFVAIYLVSFLFLLYMCGQRAPVKRTVDVGYFEHESIWLGHIRMQTICVM